MYVYNGIMHINLLTSVCDAEKSNMYGHS